MKDEHLFLVKHEHGSFVVEQFLASHTVPQARKRKFLSKIEVCYEVTYRSYCEYSILYYVAFENSAPRTGNGEI